MGIGVTDFLEGIYYRSQLTQHDDNIRQSINESETAVRDLRSTTPSLDRAIREYEDNNSFSHLLEDMEFNENDPAYIKLKYHTGGLLTKENTPTSGEKKQVNSTATIVADKINLFSNTSDEKNVNLADRKDLIADDDLRKAINEAYKLPYGEKLVEILSIFIDAFLKHTHPFPMKTPCVANGIPELELKKTELLDNGKLLSDTVRIN